MEENKEKSYSVAGNLYLSNEEVYAIQFGLGSLMEDLLKTLNDSTKPWSMEARDQMTQIIIAAKSAGDKIFNFSGVSYARRTYEPGDEEKYFTKEE